MAQYIELLRNNRNYRALWIGAIISQFGDWFNLIASAELVARISSAELAVSYLFLARFIPPFLFSPIAGVLADRYDRRKLMITSDLLRGVTVLGFLLVRSSDQLWLFYCLTAVQFILSALFVPARSAAIGNIVARNELVTANALDSFTWSTMLAIGSLVGGIVAGVFGLVTAFTLDALTFVASAWAISRLVLPPRPQREKAVGQNDGGEPRFVDGLRYLWLHPFILLVAVSKAGGSLVWGALNVLEVSFAEQVFTLGRGASLTLGIIYAVTGIGTGLGPILMRHWLGNSRPRLVRGIMIGFALVAIGIFIISQSPDLLVFSLGTLVRTVGSGTVWVFSAVLLQSLVPDEVRGRVFAFEFALLTLTQSMSILWAGVAQDSLNFDVFTISLVMSGLGVAVWLVWSLLAWRSRTAKLQFDEA